MTFSRGLTLGIAFGIVAGLVLGTAFAVMLSGRLKAARSDWGLYPIVVAAVEIPAGTVVTFDMISQRSVPQKFLNDSIVRPDSAAFVVNVPVFRAMQPGDPLYWRDYEARPLDAECKARFDAALAAQPAPDAALRALAESIRSPKKR